MSGWLVETLAATTMLMLVVLALRGTVARLFGAKWAYAMWLVPAIRVILPPLPSFLPQATLPPVVIFIPATDGLAAPKPPEIASNWEWMPFLGAVWAGVAVIFLVLQWLEYRDFLNRLNGASRPASAAGADGIAMLVSAEVDGPIALGLLHRKIVLPADFARRYGSAEQRLAIEHERIHHKRGDLWWNLAALVILAFNWFNPVAWFAFRAFRSDQELACDAAVAARVSSQERHDYALALVKSASRPGLIAACPLTRVGQLKHRLRMMRNHRISRLRSIGGGASVSAIALGAFLLGTPGFSHDAERPIVYRTAPEVLPASAEAATRVASLGREARVRPARLAPARRQHRANQPALRAEIGEPPVIVASATPLAIEPASLRMAPLPRILPTQPRAALAPVFRVYRTSSTTASETISQAKLDRIEQLILRIHSGNAGELQALGKAIEQLHGRVTVKVVHNITTEDGA